MADKRQRRVALDSFCREWQPRTAAPLLFLDLDDVVYLSRSYGGYDAFQSTGPRPDDLLKKLWHQPARDALLELLEEHLPKVVITSSWLRFSDRRDSFAALFRVSGLSLVAEQMHEAWEAPNLRGETRLGASSDGWA